MQERMDADASYRPVVLLEKKYAVYLEAGENALEALQPTEKERSLIVDNPKLNFNEGTAAKVFDINIIGNTVFSDSDIKQAFAVKESGWASIVTRNDRYAREKMAASLDRNVRNAFSGGISYEHH
jgi:outer membrane protein assembly factor BamA